MMKLRHAQLGPSVAWGEPPFATTSYGLAMLGCRSDGINLYLNPAKKIACLDRAPRWAVPREKALVHLVHGAEISDVAEVHCALYNVLKSGAPCRQDCFYVLKRQFAFRPDVGQEEFSGLRVHRALPGNKDETSRNYALRIGGP